MILVPGIDNFYQLYLESSATYYHSSRTIFQIYGTLALDHYDAYIEANSGPKQTTKTWDGQLRGTLTYRISIPTSVHISAAYHELGQRNVFATEYTQDSGDWRILAGFSHYLF